MHRFLIALLLAAAPLGAAVPALAGDQQAGPQIISSDPEEGEEFHDGAPDEVSITFSEPLDGGSNLRVFDACGRQVDAGNKTIEVNTMTVQLAKKPSGTYQAYYNAKTLRGLTGETSGILTFLVHAGPSCGDKGSAHGGHGGDGDGHGEGHSGGGEPGSGEPHEGGNGHGDNGGNSSHDSSSTASHDSSSSHSTGGTSHTSSDSSHGDAGHSGGSGPQHDAGHGDGKHGAGHGDGETQAPSGNTDIAAPGPLASGDGPLPAPQGEAVLIALLACIAIGAAGGWMARVASSFSSR